MYMSDKDERRERYNRKNKKKKKLSKKNNFERQHELEELFWKETQPKEN